MRVTRREAGIRIAQLFMGAPALAAAGSVYVVFRSVDGGVSWRRFDQGLPGDARIHAFGESGGAVLAGTDAGIFISRGRVGEWRRSAGVAAVRTNAFATSRGVVFAGTDRDGLLRSGDDGGTWATVAGFPGRRIRSMVAVGSQIYVGTNEGDVVVGDEDGQRWRSVRQGLPEPAQIFAMAAVGTNVFAGLYANGLHRWTEAEQRWRKVGGLRPLVLAAAGGMLLAGQNPGGLHWSGDLGSTWTAGTAAGGSEPRGEAPVWAMAGNERIALAGAAGGVFVSSDQGRSWRKGGGGLPGECPGIAFLVGDGIALVGGILR